MAGVQLTGLASGLDTTSIVQQLMAVEGQGRTRINLQQSAAQARQDGLKDLQGKLNLLKTAADALKSEATWGTVQSATSSDTTKLGVKTTGAAGPGGYQVDVTRLASADQHTYGVPTTPVQLSFRDDSPTSTAPRVPVDIPAGATLDEMVTVINGTKDTGVIAVNAGGKLVLAAKETGEGKRFAVDGLTEQAAFAQPGQDASFKVGTATYTSSSNVTGSALAGLELTLKGTGTSFVTVTAPAADNDAVAAQAKSFVEAYNTLVDATRTKLSEKKVPTATTTTDAKRGALFGDSGLTSMLSSLRGTFGTDAAAIGISTGASTGVTSEASKAGKLTFDSAAFSDALAKDPAAVRAKMESMVAALNTQLEPHTMTGGIMDARVTASSSELSIVKEQLTRFDARLAGKQTTYEKQFARMESALQKSQALQASMQSSLARLLG